MQLLALCISAVFLLQVSASPKAGIEGVVIGAGTGRPVPAARVTITRQEGRPGPPAISNQTPPAGTGGSFGRTPPSTASTDDSGHFVITAIVPGDYKLAAWDAIETYAFFDPELMKHADQNGKAVRVTESSKQKVTVTVQ